MAGLADRGRCLRGNRGDGSGRCVGPLSSKQSLVEEESAVADAAEGAAAVVVVAVEGRVSVGKKPQDMYQSRRYTLVPRAWRALSNAARKEVLDMGVVSLVQRKGVVTVRQKQEPFEALRKQKKRRAGRGGGGEGNVRAV